MKVFYQKVSCSVCGESKNIWAPKIDDNFPFEPDADFVNDVLQTLSDPDTAGDELMKGKYTKAKPLYLPLLNANIWTED